VFPLRLTDRIALHIALDNSRSGPNIDGRTRTVDFAAEALYAAVDLDALAARDVETAGAAVVVDFFDSAGCYAVPLHGAVGGAVSACS
jgi:hypothetical protein